MESFLLDFKFFFSVSYRISMSLFRDQRNLLVYGYINQLVTPKVPKDIKECCFWFTFADVADFFDESAVLLSPMPAEWWQLAIHQNTVKARGIGTIPLYFKYRATDVVSWKFKLTHSGGINDRILIKLVDMDGDLLVHNYRTFRYQWMDYHQRSLDDWVTEEDDAKPAVTYIHVEVDMPNTTLKITDGFNRKTGVTHRFLGKPCEFALQVGIIYKSYEMKIQFA